MKGVECPTIKKFGPRPTPTKPEKRDGGGGSERY